jgi:excisionase family DNA binding protein
MNDPILTVCEVARQLQCSSDLVRDIIARGELRAFSVSDKRNYYRIRQSWVEDYINRDRSPSPRLQRVEQPSVPSKRRFK